MQLNEFKDRLGMEDVVLCISMSTEKKYMEMHSMGISVYDRLYEQISIASVLYTPEILEKIIMQTGVTKIICTSKIKTKKVWSDIKCIIERCGITELNGCLHIEELCFDTLKNTQQHLQSGE